MAVLTSTPSARESWTPLRSLILRRAGAAGTGVGGDNHMALLVPRLCFLTQTPPRDSGYCLHLTDEEMRLREVQRMPRIPRLGNCSRAAFRTPLQAFRGSRVFTRVGVLCPRRAEGDYPCWADPHLCPQSL